MMPARGGSIRAGRYTVTHRRIEWYPYSSRRTLPLGRNVRHDSRSLDYLHTPRAGVTVKTQSWKRRIPILDQGEVGSCTGNAAAGALGTDPLYAALPAGCPALNEHEALAFYSAAEMIDGDGPYPPEDNGSSGLSVAKAVLSAGLISRYTHCTSLAAMNDALQDGPVIVGVNWYDSFDEPDSSGVVSISPNASVRGGHEFEVYATDPGSRMFQADNSWGAGWGRSGAFGFSWDTMAELLSEEGDCTRFVPLATPSPHPSSDPAGDAMWTVAGPWADQERTRPDLVTLQAALNTWGSATGRR